VKTNPPAARAERSRNWRRLKRFVFISEMESGSFIQRATNNATLSLSGLYHGWL